MGFLIRPLGNFLPKCEPWEELQSECTWLEHIHSGIKALSRGVFQRDYLYSFCFLASLRCLDDLVARLCPNLLWTHQTVVHQAPLTMGFFQARILDWDAISFPRGFFPTQRLNLGLLHGMWSLYQLSYQGRPSCLGFTLFLNMVLCI